MSLDSKIELGKIISMVSSILKKEGQTDLANLLSIGDISSEMVHYDNWDGGQYYYTIHLSIPLNEFIEIQEFSNELENTLKEKIELLNKVITHEHVSEVIIIPERKQQIDWESVSNLTSKEKLIQSVEFLKNTMISVATGGQMIQDINSQYSRTFSEVDKILNRLNIHNPNPYNDLWQWYGKWSTDFRSYAERRSFISEMYNILIFDIKDSEDSSSYNIQIDLKGWPKIERSISEIKKRLSEAKNEEQFQSIGHLSRELIITLAQKVHDKEKHPSLDGVTISKTDAKRMLESYFSIMLGGSSNENTRKYAKSTLTLANQLTHKRTATKKDALLCCSATFNLVNIVKIIDT